MDEPDGILAVEIHDLDERNVLAFDLTELLDALGPSATELDWIVTDYHPVTDEDEAVEAFADSVYHAQRGDPRSGVRITGRELRELGNRSLQTIDGQFIGIPADSETDPVDVVDLGTFPSSDAALVVKAVDSSFWIVITKSDHDVNAIRERFRDVRHADRTLELGYQLGP
jgi:hypothetical protein